MCYRTTKSGRDREYSASKTPPNDIRFAVSASRQYAFASVPGSGVSAISMTHDPLK